MKVAKSNRFLVYRIADFDVERLILVILLWFVVIFSYFSTSPVMGKSG